MVTENKIRSIHEHKGKQRNARNRLLWKKKTQINENRGQFAHKIYADRPLIFTQLISGRT